MKPRFALSLLVAASLFASLGTAFALDPDAIDPGMSVGSLSLEQCRLHRFAIQARHCQLIDDTYGRNAFNDYQRVHCGFENELVGEAPLEPTELTAAETDLVRRLLEREHALQASRLKVPGGAARYDTLAIANRSQFTNLPDDMMQRLARDGWAAAPGKQQQLFYIYEQNDYHMVPSFITTDLMLQLMHLYFDRTLRDLEEKQLFAAADTLCREMGASLRRQYVAGGSSSRALEKAVLYFAVAEGLAHSQDAWTPPAWVDATWRAPLAAQAALIFAATDLHKGPILGTVDYSLFKPRGHYTRSPALTRYFRLMSWLGVPGFVFDEEIVPLETALAICHTLARDPRLKALYESVESPIAFYVGPCDDITPALVIAVADRICGSGASLAEWCRHQDEIRDELKRRDPTRIKVAFADDRQLPQIRFLGQRYVPDSEIFQELVDWLQRPIPTGVDVFAAIGVPAAVEIMRATRIAWPAYWPRMARLQATFTELPPPSDQDNLYWQWLRVLRVLNGPPPAAAPPFMTAANWPRKNLVAGLGSWAELRHDTILYAKQSGAECGGDNYLPRRVPGYVEPRPEVFDAMRELVARTRLHSGADLPGSSGAARAAEDLQEKLAFLAGIARKELAHEPLSARELEEIRVFGAMVSYLSMHLLAGNAGSEEWSRAEGPDRRMAIIADVHTTGDKVLEVGVGDADEIYVLVEDGEDLIITRGAMFSYHEFTQPREQRLTDEKWQGMLDSGNVAPRLPWLRDLLAPAPLPDLPSRYRYSSGC